MITRIKIKGYKSIYELDLELESINVLLGSNGVGKSNFISIFSLIRNIYNQNLQGYVLKKGGANSLLHFGKKETQNILLGLEFSHNEEKNRYIVKLEEGTDSLFIKYTETQFLKGKWHENVVEKNCKESSFKSSNKGQNFYINPLLRQFDVYHFHDTSDTSPMKAKCELEDNHYLKSDGSNLAAYLYYLQETSPKHFKRIEGMICSIAPFFSHFDLKPSRLKSNKIQLEWKEKGAPDTYFNAYHLSDGTLRFIALATLLMQPKLPKTIIIDEPELGLHPVAINKLASLIRKASKETQIIVSTQSTNFVDNFEAKNIIITERSKEGKSTIFKRLDEASLDVWLEDYTLGDIWGKNIIGGQPIS